MLIRCLPMGLCSWNFRLLRDGREVGRTEQRHWFEQGAVRTAEGACEVTKEGMLSGQWTLSRAGAPGVPGAAVATATKPSALFRRFRLGHESGGYELAAITPVTRPFELLGANGRVAVIRPDHPFTRRATIDADDALPLELAGFAFWLTAMLWKRAANSGGAAAAGS
jgi:hypothetical protein